MNKVSVSWADNIKTFLDKRSLTMLFLGFSAGLPILLIFSSLSLWLREAGSTRSEVTYFSWAALGYSFKFIWAPLIDRLPVPFLTSLLGRRRAWLLLSQLMVILSICWMAFTNPISSIENSMVMMAIGAVLLGFSSATQDIVVDAFRIESADTKMQATLSATYIAGYRIGMVVAGAGSLFLAEMFGSKMGSYSYEAWRNTYLIMAMCMGVGVATTFFRPEPKVEIVKDNHSTKDYIIFFILFLVIVGCFICAYVFSSSTAIYLTTQFSNTFNNKDLAGFIVGTLRMFFAIGVSIILAIMLGKASFINTKMIEQGYVDPVKNFFDRYGKGLALLLLSLVGLYRISDIVLGVISNVFYQDLGFSKTTIATAVKTFGVVMSILGGFLGGLLTTRVGVIKMLWWGAILSAGTNLLFMVLAIVGKNTTMLYFTIAIDNLAAGLASAAFVAFLSALTDVSFTAVQYAIFSSLMTLIPKVFGGYSGTIVDSVGYEWFFVFTTLIGVPVLYIIHLASKKFNIKET